MSIWSTMMGSVKVIEGSTNDWNVNVPKVKGPRIAGLANGSGQPGASNENGEGGQDGDLGASAAFGVPTGGVAAGGFGAMAAIPGAEAAGGEDGEAAPAATGGGGWGVSLGGMGLTAKKEEEDTGFDDDADQQNVPLDPDMGFYLSTFDLESRLADRCFDKAQTNHITIADVEGEMEELKTDKDLGDANFQEIKSELEQLAKNTVSPKRESDIARPKPDANRLCQIENRLLNDPSLAVDDEYDDGDKFPFEYPENAAMTVKRNLVRVYGKIKKTDYTLSPQVIHALDEKIGILKKN